MKNTIILSPILFFFVFSILICNFAFSQVLQKNEAKLSLYYTDPNSDITFKKVWEGVMDAEISYNYFFDRNIFGGFSFDYSKFQIDPSKLYFTLRTKMYIISPSLVIGYRHEITNDIFINGVVKAGYSWNIFRNEDYPDEVKSYDNSGFSAAPAFEAYYKILSYLNVGFQLSYKIIFAQFGKDYGYEPKEDPNIRYWKFGICTSVSF